LTVVGVAIGLGNVWRFPYMVGKFGGAAFVLFYVLVAAAIGVPGLMAEFALGRSTRRGPVGAFAAAGLPLGKYIGWFFFAVVTAATGYYTAVVGWVLYHAIGQVASGFNIPLMAAAILPPDSGFQARSFLLQLACTGTVVLACTLIVIKGLRSGIERASKIIVPSLFGAIIVLMIRSLTLPGAMEGVRWYILKLRFADLTPIVMFAAMGHTIFSLSLGGTFMVVYGSYLDDKESLVRPAMWTTVGDTLAALLAGFAIIPAVIALGLEPSSGPGLLFATLPKVFAAIPFGAAFGCLFFLSLFGAAYLSDVGAFEVLVAGLTDNTRLCRTHAAVFAAVAVFLVSIPPTINSRIFVPWDLTFGSGMQTFGAFVAVLTVGWCMNRSTALRQLGSRGERAAPMWLFYWIRFGIPAAVGGVGIWWLLSSVLHKIRAV